MKRVLLVLCLFAAMVTPLFSAGTTDSYEGRIGANATIEVKSDIPSIRIVTNSSENRVTARLEGASSDRFIFTARESRDGFSVEVKRKRSLGVDLFTMLPAELVITIPRGATLGDLEISAVSGSVTIEDDLHVREIGIGTVSGAISVPTLSAERKVTFESVSGAIRGDVVTAPSITIGSVSGKIDIRELVAPAGQVSVETVSGSTSIGSLHAPISEIQTVSGSTTITLPASFAGTVETASVSGSIQVTFPRTQQVQSDRQRTYYQLGTGNDYSKVSTISGRVTISQQSR